MTALETRLLNDGAQLELPGGFRSTLLTRSRDRKGLQGIHLVERGGARYIYKVYGARRNPIKELLGHAASFIEGRTSPAPAKRRDTERRCLRLWREHGFDVFREIESAPEMPFGLPSLCLEYVPGRSALKYLSDPAVAREEKLAALRRLADDLTRRHELAQRLNEPLLIHEHPSLEHIWRGEDGRFRHFDFEVAYRRGRLPQHIGREALRFIRAALRCAPDAEREEYLALLLERYRLPEFLRIACDDLWRSRNPFVRVVRSFERRAPRARRPLSQFAVARMVMAKLPQAGKPSR